MFFGKKILNYKEEILRDINELIKIKSVSSIDKETSSKALEYVLKRAEDMGFKTKNIQGIAGHAEFGEGNDLAAVLVHVDVVPAGEGWSVEPYALTEKDGRLYGRGIVDDKGPAIVALYCLKAFKDSGIIPKRRIRVIFGVGEEIGMKDMETYFNEEEMPIMAFTPDSEYGICNCEKGILQIEISSQKHKGAFLTEFHAGNAVNAVPSKAYAFVSCTEHDIYQLRHLSDSQNGKYDFVHTADGVKVNATGKATHGSTPELGINAATHLIKLLSEKFGQCNLDNLCKFLDSAIGLETDGKSLGISCSDEQSGALTLNIGKVDINEDISHALIDIRYPVTADFMEILETIDKKASCDKLNVSVLNHEKPLSVDKNSPVIGILEKAYKTVTMEDAKIYSTGGGTYARTLKNNGVAFGPVFEGDQSNIHDVDESINKENFLKHAQICLEAMYGFAVL